MRCQARPGRWHHPPGPKLRSWHARDLLSHLVSRPLFGPAGAAALPGIVAAQTRGKERFGRMVEFFGAVGSGEGAGYGFAGVPQPRKKKPAIQVKLKRDTLADAVGA